MENIDIEPHLLSHALVNVLHSILNITKLKVEFLDGHVDYSKGNILVFNHLSHIETIFIPILLHKRTLNRFYSLMHHSFFVNKPMSWLNRKIWYCVSTKDEDKYLKMMKAVLNNYNVIIYPQGGICKIEDDVTLSKTGPAYLATMLKKQHPNKDVCIVPGRITYSPIKRDDNWLSKITGLSELETNAMLTETKVIIRMGRPIEIEDVPETEIERLDYIARIRDRYHNFITGKHYKDIADWREDNPPTKNELAREKALFDAWVAENPGKSIEIQKDYREL